MYLLYTFSLIVFSDIQILSFPALHYLLAMVVIIVADVFGIPGSFLSIVLGPLRPAHVPIYPLWRSAVVLHWGGVICDAAESAIG